MESRCPGCMRIKHQPVCEHCGFVEGTTNELHQLPVGSVLRDHYVIGKVLGQGGFGITYLGWDRYLETVVAIKEYYPSGQVSRNGVTSTAVITNIASAKFQEGRARFVREARTLAKLQNVGNIVTVSNFFEENNTAYIVMEYIQGITLEEYIRQRGGKLTPSETFTVLRPIMEALHRVHEAGMIHRDISPDNIMLQDNGTLKILDFGTARDVDASGEKLAHSTQAVLKYGFAPVEQYAAGRGIDRRADEYALCVTFYYCLTGKTPPDALQRMMDGTPLEWESIPGLTDRQRQVLAKGTAIKAEDRYPDLKALEDALFGDAPVEPVKPKKKRRWLIPVIAAIVAVAALIGVLALKASQEAKEKAAAEAAISTTEGVHLPASAQEIREAVWAAYGKGEKFPVISGNTDASTMGASGIFDLLGESVAAMISADALDYVTEASFMAHMININTFTCATFKLAEGVSVEEVLPALRETILGSQWPVGSPEVLGTCSVTEEYIVIVFGDEEQVDVFFTHLAEVYPMRENQSKEFFGET